MAELQITHIRTVDKSAECMHIEEERLNEALLRMGNSVKNRAELFAPVLTGALRDNGRVRVGRNSVVIAFGGLEVPYGRRRHYENKKHPQTLLYLQRAGDAVAREGIVRFL